MSAPAAWCWGCLLWLLESPGKTSAQIHIHLGWECPVCTVRLSKHQVGSNCSSNQARRDRPRAWQHLKYPTTSSISAEAAHPAAALTPSRGPSIHPSSLGDSRWVPSWHPGKAAMVMSTISLPQVPTGSRGLSVFPLFFSTRCTLLHHTGYAGT